MATINTNMSAKVASNSLVRNDRTMGATMERLSTGLRINSAKDDAAGLAISSKMTSQIRGLDQAVRNANDAISMIQVAEGAMKEVTNMFQRMRELAVQAISDSNTQNDRAALNNEFKQLSQEVQRIAGNTQWNGTNILDDSIGTAGVSTFQVGANADQTIRVDFGDLATNYISDGVTAPSVDSTSEATMTFAVSGIAQADDILSFKTDDGNYVTYTLDADMAAAINADKSYDGTATPNADAANATAIAATSGTITSTATGGNLGFTIQSGDIVISGGSTTGVHNVDISDATVSRGLHAPVATQDILNRTNASDALSVLDTAIQKVNDTRALLGASMSRLEYASDNLQNVSQNASAARSRVLDADYANETTELARTQIIQQAGTAMLSQANQSQQSVLSLLK